jgi:hypothetical protein
MAASAVTKGRKYKTVEEFRSDTKAHNHFYHNLTTYQYDLSLVYRSNDVYNMNSKIEEYASDKTIFYNFIMSNTESNVLNTYYNSSLTKQNLTTDITPLPLAVRYADQERGFYVVERPPFQIELNYSFKKGPYRKEIPALKGKKIWIPWTLSVVHMGNSISDYHHKMYALPKPLNTLEDDSIYPVCLPNIFADGRICLGDSVYHMNQRISDGSMKYNFSDVFNYAFNDFFNSWNPDLTVAPNIAYSALQSIGCFDKIKNSGVKKHPKNFDDVSYWKKSHSKFWFFFLYSYSYLTYEEVLDFYKAYNDLYKSRGFQPPANFRVLIDTHIKNKQNEYNYYNSSYSSVVRSGWSSFFRSQYDDIVNSTVSVCVKNIPENTLINKDFVSNPKFIAYVYYQIFNIIAEAISKYNKENQTDSDFYSPFVNILNIDDILSFKNTLNGSNSDLINFIRSFIHERSASKALISADYSDFIGESL